jgi:hypothetical protein
MNPTRTCLFAFVLAAVALTPVRAYAAAPPRVVSLLEVAAKAFEVPISSKQLTLIHFETGDVGMVAVGDPTIVNVTVKGPDVLLKALASSGSTNAFIWQAGRYTQWTLTVRQNSKDPRLIIVKESVAITGDEPSSQSVERGGRDKKTVTSEAPTTTKSGPPLAGATVGSATTPPAPAQQPSTAIGSEQSANTQAMINEACGKSLVLDQFTKTLNDRQRELFGMFLTEPTLARLQALVRELSPQQRCDLLALLSVSASSKQAPVDPPRSAGTTPGPSTTAAQNNGQAAPQTAQVRPEPQAQRPPSSEASQPDSSAPAPVALTVIPELIDGQVFLYYTLENQGEATLLADILRLRIFDRNGARLAFRISRASEGGYLGRLEQDGVEYGVIAVDASEKSLVLEWKLIQLGSGAQQLMRAEVQVPEKIVDPVSP